MESKKITILMVCLGNICRSPLAEGILKHRLEEEDLLDVEVDSCGFERYHLNDSPDYRSVEVAKKHGINISNQHQRLFKYNDFVYFDKIYVMDANNFSDVASVARTKDDLKKVDFITNILTPNQNKAVPDPYYGGIEGFEKAYSILSDCIEEIILKIKTGRF